MKKIKRRKIRKDNEPQESGPHISPESALGYYNRGCRFHGQGRIAEAVTHYQKSLQYDPYYAPSLFNLGAVYHAENQLDLAIQYYESAVRSDPGLIAAHYNLGTILQGQKKLDKAVMHYQKAIDLNPDLVDPYYNMGLALQEQGRQEEALAAYENSLRLNPSFFLGRWAKCIAQIPLIYPDPSSVQVSRENYRRELVKLSETMSLRTRQEIDAATEAVGKQQPFFLAYQGLNDRGLQEIYGNLVCRIMSAKYPQFASRPRMPSFLPGETLRIGIVSGFFYYHAAWKIPVKGWIENLDKRRFNLYGYYTGAKKDRETEAARKCFTRFVEDISSFEELCESIRRDKLHVLLFPEIGMDPATLKLAALRLAPVQVASWGHADTSGLPTIDYYLSGDLMEPADGDQHYTENLIRLPNLSICYTPPDIRPADVSRDTLGLRPDSVLYHCCQSLYKHSPQYDEVFPRIAAQVRDCQFLFASYPNITYLIEQFRARIARAFDRFHLNADDHVVFLPPLPPDWYQALNALTDVYLDTIGWSGCNSVLEALSFNLPVVTCPTGLMRGREGFGILTMMGATETIASTPGDYVDLAVRLGNDAEWRSRISDNIEITKHLAYRDASCIKGLEDFLVQVVTEKLGQKK